MTETLYAPQAGGSSVWFTVSLLLHGLMFLALIWQATDVQPVLQPAPAVMLKWSDNTVVPLSPVPLPVGIAQQGSAATEEKQQTKDKQQQPSPEAAGILLSG